jgi:hypothetical protein
MRQRTHCWMPRAKSARGKVLGALPRIPARGTSPETPGPLSLLPHVPERSSPSRVRFAAQNPRALDRSGPFRRFPQIRESGQTAKPFCGSPAFRWSAPELRDNFRVDKTS